MKTVLVTGFLAIAGCSAAHNDFTIEDRGGRIRAANLDLCGSSIPLRRWNERFSLSWEVDCEGSGKIELVLASGQKASCPIGYVTPGAKQDFRFRLVRTGCERVLF